MLFVDECRKAAWDGFHQFECKVSDWHFAFRKFKWFSLFSLKFPFYSIVSIISKDEIYEMHV